MRSFPWDSVATILGDNGFPIYDRAFSSNDLAKVCEVFFSYGIYIGQPESLQVIADEGMSVIVNPGFCHNLGRICWEDDYRKLSIQAPSSQDRIDTIVIRADANTESRDVDVYVKKGVAQEVPERPELTRNETVYELGIADIFVPKNSTSITQDRITDTRLDNGRCGVMTPLLHVDTTQFFEQLQSAVSRAVQLADDAIAGTIAGNLQSEIEELNNTKVNRSGDTITGNLSVKGSVSLTNPLPVASGGTGVTSLQALRNAAGLGNTTGVLPVGNGGTGANNAASARANLGTLGAVSANGYYGMTRPDGNTSDWIRTTSSGIIPDKSSGFSGDGGGSASLGTSSWPFSHIYAAQIHVYNTSIYGTTISTAASTALHISVASRGGSTYMCSNGLHVGPLNNTQVSTTSNYKAVAASAFTTKSSRDSKENIEQITDSRAEEVLDVDVVTFDYKGEESENDRTGLIAEDVREIIPEAVIEMECNDDDGSSITYIGIDYSRFVPYLIKLGQIERVSQLDTDEAIVSLYEQQLDTDEAIVAMYESITNGE